MSSEYLCDFCAAPAQFVDNIWGVKHWCLECEDAAAWEIYSEAYEEIES